MINKLIKLVGYCVYVIANVLDSLKRRYEKELFAKVGKCTTIGKGGIFTHSTISIGSYCHIGKMACLQSRHGKIVIGDHVMLGPYVSMHGGNHIYDTIGSFMTDVKKEPNVDGEIVIEDNVWIGANAIILKGVRIRRGCVIGAGTIVTKSTAPYSVYTGVPAKLIKFYWGIDDIMKHESIIYEH